MKFIISWYFQHGIEPDIFIYFLNIYCYRLLQIYYADNLKLFLEQIIEHEEVMIIWNIFAIVI